MFQDLRQGFRVLLQSKGWTLVVLLSLALGIGANTVVFSALNGLLFAKLKVANPDGLVRLRWVGPNDMVNSRGEYGYRAKDPNGPDIGATFSYAIFEELRANNQTMSDLFACAPSGKLNVLVNGEADLASSILVTGSYFQTLGVLPAAGRLLQPDDDRADAPTVAVLSYGYWNRKFAADAGIIGQVVTMNNTPVTIVGVTRRDFGGVQEARGALQDVILPARLEPVLGSSKRMTIASNWWLEIMGRLKPGVTAEQVRSNLDHVFQNATREGLDTYLAGLSAQDRSLSRNQNRTRIPTLRVESGSRGVYDTTSSAVNSMTILGSVVGIILLIVCANVANLLLSRATARQKEISIRLSMGATRGRLVRQLLTESVCLASLGGALGLLFTYWGREWFPGISEQRAQLDWHVFGFASALVMFTGVVFGLAPALRATRLDLALDLKENSRNVSGRRSFLSKGLMVVQVAMSLVLLIAAGLFLRTLDNLRRVDLGFNAQNILVFRVDPVLNRYDQARIAALYDQITESLRRLPRVEAVSMSAEPLLSGGSEITSFIVQGREAENYRKGIHLLNVAPNFFGAMEIPLVAGRMFTLQDDLRAPKVAMINEAAARMYFPNENPVGRRFGDSPERSGTTEIVGVVRDAKYDSIRDAAPPTEYTSLLQSPFRGVSFELRTAGDPITVMPSVRTAIHQIDANLPLSNVSSQKELIEERFSQEREFASAYAMFGSLALLLASIGLFGLMSYSVSRRTNEIGIRMALGAEQRNVVRMVMSESLILVVLGIAIGVCVALASGRLVQSTLFGLAPTDPVTIIIAVTVMLVVSAIAGYLPARRASRVDPLTALRYE